MEYVEWKWVLLISMVDFETFGFNSNKWLSIWTQKQTQEMFPISDLVPSWRCPQIWMNWIAFLLFTIVWRRKTHDSKCFSLWTYMWFHLCFYTFFSNNQFPCSQASSNNLHDMSFYLVSPNFVCLLHFGIPFSPLVLLWFSHFDTN